MTNPGQAIKKDEDANCERLMYIYTYMCIHTHIFIYG